MSKPLEGIRVLDLTTFVAAPVCARMLGELGAEVIKIEPPKGDAWRETSRNFNVSRFGDHMNPIFDIYNSGKKLIALNLKSEEGKEIFWKLMDQADVFITNNRPEALKRLGISYEDVKDRFPGLIYAMILGYGETGPEANTPGFDVTAFWARSGFLRDMALTDGEYQPLMPPSAAGDTVTGTNLCAEICAALVRKLRTGKGDYVRSCLYQSGIFTFGTMQLATQQPGGRQYPRSRTAGGSAGGVTGTYCCSDGEWLFMANGGSAVFLPRIFNMIGRPELCEDQRYMDKDEAAKPENILGIYQLLKEAFLKKTRAEWLSLAKEFDIPVVKLNHFNENATDEQALANGFMEEMVYENGDKIMMPTIPLMMESVGKVKTQITPRVGGDTEEVLLSIGYSQAEIDAMAQSGVITVYKK